MEELGSLYMLINKFGNEVKIIDCEKLVAEDELKQAKIRHLKAVRMRYLDYVIKMKSPSDRVLVNAILAERMLKQNERI